MSPANRSATLSLVGLLGLGAYATAFAADDSVTTYTAVYDVEYKGKELGSSEFKVRHVAERDVYEFSTRLLVKGFLKLARPNPVIERSEFRTLNGRIQPREFWYEDGSRKGEDNLHIVFHWDRNVAIVSGEGGRREIALQAGALDRGSLQVALMADLAANGRPGHYLLADEDSTTAYDYTDNGDATIATGLGPLATRSFMQQRENSSRSTWLWFAPALNWLPVRIEQRRNGEVQTAFTLASVEGLPTTK
jgi:hypothetical protein